ncbi:hypothetical protein JAAARDRAFT_79126 [Jaapia argillacea MUCL 33604]|uniref:PIG-F-domain-containing protein n=1 Tax=Jaapia argillacea MUCL 33604 TaxID=933084 RepID=A0A067PP62_9AGAM|nr:hypothetical protein JAAARDRAFT_79126 [Jaapia argillacea MUCL 33604]
MARKPKSKAQVQASPSTASIPPASTHVTPAPTSAPSFPFPYTSYASLVGIHTSLLTFTLLFLPRTSLFLPSNPLIEGLRFSPNLSFAAGFEGGQTEVALGALGKTGWISLGVVVLQVWWAGKVRGWARLSGGGDRNRSDDSDLLNAYLSTFVTCLIIYVSLVLFGAPLTSHITHTTLLSLTLSFLTTFPPAYTLGFPPFSFFNATPKNGVQSGREVLNRFTWVRLFVEFMPKTPLERTLTYPFIGTFIGCWLGAIPMGLDWERDWLVWPIPPLYTSIMGYIIGSLSAVVINSLEYLAIVGRVQEQSDEGKVGS